MTAPTSRTREVIDDILGGPVWWAFIIFWKLIDREKE